MKKLKVLSLIASLVLMTGCAKTTGIEKQYTMNVKEAPISCVVDKDSPNVLVAHCTRGMSLYNYYIELPELEQEFEIPEKLIAKVTDDKKNYYIMEDGKLKNVTNHGYQFVSWVL